MNTLLRSSLLVGLLSIQLLSTSCGKKQEPLVAGAQVTSSLVDDEIIANLKIQFNLGNTALPAITLPINDPNHPEINYGEIRTAPTMDGKNEVSLSVNVTNALKVQGGLASLPNGNSLPVGGLAGVQVIQIQIPNTKARIYLAMDRGVAMMGFALSIDQLNSIGRAIAGIDLFPAFTIGPVKGVAGIFTGRDAGQTGIAAFVDLSSVFTPDLIQLAFGGASKTDYQAAKVSTYKEASQLSFNGVNPNAKSKSKLENLLYDFGTQRRKVQLTISK